MIYLISYDITSNKKRYKISKLLKGQGAVRLQKSVFAIHLSRTGLKGLRQSLHKAWGTATKNNDKLFILKIHQTAFHNMSMLGQQLDPILALGQASVVVI